MTTQDQCLSEFIEARDAMAHTLERAKAGDQHAMKAAPAIVMRYLRKMAAAVVAGCENLPLYHWRRT